MLDLRKRESSCEACASKATASPFCEIAFLISSRLVASPAPRWARSRVYVLCISASPALTIALYVCCNFMSAPCTDFPKFFHISLFTSGVTRAVQFVGRGYFSILSFTFSADMELRNLLLARFANDSATGGAMISWSWRSLSSSSRRLVSESAADTESSTISPSLWSSMSVPLG